MREHDYNMRSHPSYLNDAIASVQMAQTITQATRRESVILRERMWSQLEADLIRLAAISRRQQIALRYDSCTIVERMRKGRPQARDSKRPVKERTCQRQQAESARRS